MDALVWLWSLTKRHAREAHSIQNIIRVCTSRLHEPGAKNGSSRSQQQAKLCAPSQAARCTAPVVPSRLHTCRLSILIQQHCSRSRTRPHVPGRSWHAYLVALPAGACGRLAAATAAGRQRQQRERDAGAVVGQVLGGVGGLAARQLQRAEVARALLTRRRLSIGNSTRRPPHVLGSRRRAHAPAARTPLAPVGRAPHPQKHAFARAPRQAAAQLLHALHQHRACQQQACQQQHGRRRCRRRRWLTARVRARAGRRHVGQHRRKQQRACEAARNVHEHIPAQVTKTPGVEPARARQVSNRQQVQQADGPRRWAQPAGGRARHENAGAASSRGAVRLTHRPCCCLVRLTVRKRPMPRPRRRQLQRSRATSLG